ncbi:MAG: DUF1573 domain-containing protein [Ignavibacteriae bacterium]|nr:MAG: DUF1573 domain-containing protein [Ignavibacteriota bacterium]
MKQTGWILLIVLFGVGISSGQPKLSLNKPVVDLGTIYSGMKKQGKIVLRNIGTDTLRIYSVQPSCGCTTVKQPKSFLLPSESDVVELEFNSTGYHGTVEKHVNIVTNDPLAQNVTVTLSAVVKEDLESISHSSLLWLGNIVQGKTLVQNAGYKNISGRRIKINKFTTSSSSISVRLDKKVLNPNDTLQIQVSVKAEKPGYGSESFTLETDSKNQPRIEMRASFVCIKEK